MEKTEPISEMTVDITDRKYGEHASRDNSLSSIDEQDLAKQPLSAKLVTRIDLHVVPTLAVLYLVSFLDRVNISNALLYGLPKDLHTHGNQINTALALLFITYVSFEIPATIVMKKVTPQKFLPVCTVIFGILLTLHGVVQNYAGLVALRVIMGIFEAGIYPSCYYLLGMWYKRDEAQKRFSFFFVGCSLAGAFGGLIATGIGRMDGVGGYRAWRWIFILEGLATVIISIISFFTVSDFPETAKWLTEEERRHIVVRLAADQGASGIEEKLGLKDLTLVFKDWKILLSAPLYFGIVVSIYGLAFFIPTIISSYGYTPIEAQLHSVIPWCASLVWALGTAYFSDRFKVRSPFIAVSLALALVGNIMLFTIHDKPNVEYAGVFLYLMGCCGTIPVIVCWYTMNLHGHRERAIGIPYMVGFGNASGLVGTFAFPPSTAPRYILGYSLGLGFLLFSSVIVIIYVVGYSLENRKKNGRHRYML